MKAEKAVMIIGSSGSMGKRYQAILKYLDRGFACADEHTPQEMIAKIAADPNVGYFIVATPTDTHAKIVEMLLPLRKPILCEKPLARSSKTARHMFARAKEWGTPLHMVLQYQFAYDRDAGASGGSWYNYFRHGNDGLLWDCLQIIGLANDVPEIYEDSPIWFCCINGIPLKSGDMDLAYVEFTKRWLEGTLEQRPEDIIAMHEKVESMIQNRRWP